MEDSRILDLFWARDEEAVSAVSAKYGPYCRAIARNLLGNAEDTEECLNDTWHQAWQRIPPQRPQHLKPWLGKVVRGIAINRWNRNHAEKRGSGLDLLLSELEDCIPGERSRKRPWKTPNWGPPLAGGSGPCPRRTGCSLSAGTGTVSP